MKVTGKVPDPFVSAEIGGAALREGRCSVKRTVPEYEVSTLFDASSAVTVKVIGRRESAVDGAVTEKCKAGEVGPPPPRFGLGRTAAGSAYADC